MFARENLLYTYIDNYKFKFKKKPSAELIKEIAEIISWNIFQMDGMKGVIPLSCNMKKLSQTSIFGEEEVIKSECVGCLKGIIHKHNGIYVKVMNWNNNKKIKFIDLYKGR